METDPYFEGFEAALNLIDIELEKLFRGAKRLSGYDAVLDVKNEVRTLRSMMINGEDLVLTQDQT